VREPVQVVAVVDDGEEAFVVHRDGSGAVSLTLRSLTRPAPQGPWRVLFPALLVAQRYFRRRYLRALTA
jgi:uncharacterized protein (UPF0548 family)